MSKNMTILNKFNVDVNGCIDGYAFSNQYKLIKYSDLYDIFKKSYDSQYKKDILREFKMLSSEQDNFDQNRQIYSFLKKAGL